MCTDERAEAQSPGGRGSFWYIFKIKIKTSTVMIKLIMSRQEVEKVCVCKILQAFWK